MCTLNIQDLFKIGSLLILLVIVIILLRHYLSMMRQKQEIIESPYYKSFAEKILLGKDSQTNQSYNMVIIVSFFIKLYSKIPKTLRFSSSKIQDLIVRYKQFEISCLKVTNPKIINLPHFSEIEKGQIIEYYSKYSNPFIGYWNKSNELVKKKISQRIQKIRKKKNKVNILDVGCGEGWLYEQSGILKSGDFLGLVDSNRKVLKKTRTKIISLYPDIICEGIYDNDIYNFDEIDISKLCTPDGSTFDVIICCHVISHIHTELIDKYFNLMSRLLSKDGVIFILTPLSDYKTHYYFDVDGLSYDIYRIEDECFDKFINNHVYLPKLQEKTSFNPDDEYYSYYSALNSENEMYYIANRKNYYLLYRRRFDVGLMNSINYSDIIDEEQLICKLKVICQQENHMSSVQYSDCSTKWLIYSEHEKKYILAIYLENNIRYYPVLGNTAIGKIRQCKYSLDKNEVPKNIKLELQRILPNVVQTCYKDIYVIQIEPNVWEFTLSQTYHIRIIELRSKYVLILTDSFIREISVNSVVVDNIGKLFLEGNNIFKLIDTEFEEGIFINIDNKISFYARYDEKNIHVFKINIADDEKNTDLKYIMTRLSKSINEKELGFFSLNIDGDKYEIRCLIKGKSWIGVQKNSIPKKRKIPKFRIFKINNNYYFYRDINYHRIPKTTYNELCDPSININKLLPTNHILLKYLTDILEENNLKTSYLFHYHVMHHSFLPNCKMRDLIYNFIRDFMPVEILPPKYRKILKAQDSLIIVKKK